VQRRALQGEQSTSVLVAYVEAWSPTGRCLTRTGAVGPAPREVFDCCTMWLRLCRELQLTPAAEAKLEIERAKLAAEHADEDPFD
jgi:phage terminase small subunit